MLIRWRTVWLLTRTVRHPKPYSGPRAVRLHASGYSPDVRRSSRCYVTRDGRCNGVTQAGFLLAHSKSSGP